VNLRRRQADTVIFVHRLDHVVDQLLDRSAADLGLVERPGFGAQHRVTHPRDLQNRHTHRIILAGRG
jgi:hypothetical protein